MDKKIAAMHKIYGADPLHTCKTCCNLVSYRQSHIWHKCRVYGQSSSITTDWRLKHPACGHYGKPFDPKMENTIMHAIGAGRKQQEPVEPDPRQLTLLEGKEAEQE